MKPLTFYNFVIPILLLLACFQTSAYAIEETITTATRTEQNLNSALAASYIVSNEQISRMQASDISDILNRVAGLSVLQSGGEGSNTSLFVRGTNSNHVLILVNGQRINSATLGLSAFQFISPEQIQRIEIINGPRASLYGSDAVGGVINIITKTDIEDTARFLVKSSAGFYGKSAHSLGAQGKMKWAENWNSSVSVGIDYSQTKDFDRTVTNTGGNGDDDHYQNQNTHFSFEQQLGKFVTIGIEHLESDGRTEYDNACSLNAFPYSPVDCEPYADVLVQNTSFYLKSMIEDIIRLRFTYSQSKDENNTGDHLVPDPSTIYGGDSYFQTKRDSASLQGDFIMIDNHVFTLGVDYYKDEVDSLIRTTDAMTFMPVIQPHLDEDGNVVETRDNQAIFAQFQSTYLDKIDLAVSAREDDNEAFGKKSTGNFAAGLHIAKTQKIYLSYGTAFKAPTFNDLYWPDPFGPGNPGLDPETSRNIELGLKGHNKLHNWQASVYRNRIEDLIQWQPVPGSPLGAWTPTNVAKVNIEGLEASFQSSIDNWIIGSNFSYIITEDKATGKELARRPRSTFRLDIDHQFHPSFTVGGSILANGRSYDDTANKDRLGGYTLVDLRVSLQAHEDVKLQFKLSNVFDKQYVTQRNNFLGTDYETEGRGAMFSISYTPGF